MAQKPFVTLHDTWNKKKKGRGLVVSLGPGDRWNKETDQGANAVCPDEICQEGQVAEGGHTIPKSTATFM